MGLIDNIRHPTASGIFAALPGIANDMAARPGEEETLTHLAQLAASDTPEEAITFAAQMLVPRLSIWWGHECLKSMPEVLTQTDEHLMQIAAAWVGDPSEENWASATAIVDATNDRSPGIWLGFAVRFSGGSLVSEGARRFLIPPPPEVCGRCVNAAALTALALGGPEQRADRIGNFVSMADILARSE